MERAVTGEPRAAVIIPAHNEAAVLGRCLATLLSAADPGEFEVVVACNGCRDATADVARRVAPEARVLELGEANKARALQAGDDAARGFPRIYLDADIELDTFSARRLAEALTGDRAAVAASPTMAVRLDDRSWAIRAFYRIWLSLPWSGQAHLGDGCYGLSAAGRARFTRWPALMADDLFANRLFAAPERRAVLGATFVVHPPRTIRSLTKVRTRVCAGNLEYGRAVTAGQRLGAQRDRPGPGPYLRLLWSPANWPALAVYLAVTLTARLRARSRQLAGAGTGAWDRDDTARTP
jgi:glycosyltransferase involved in cell wall biosynthesis